MRNRQSLISFSFDDFPRSALYTGGAILEQCGVSGTYYASFGLMGQVAPTGRIFGIEDVFLLLQRGHELGCHTYNHCHAYTTPRDCFARSVLRNRQALEELAPGKGFKTLSYPISFPRPATKLWCSQYFLACRGGGQTYNVGNADLNGLRAFFLEQSLGDIDAVKALIDENVRIGGWLIFATHDVSAEPTRYGCTGKFFTSVLHHAVDSGAAVLRVSQALQEIGADQRTLRCRKTFVTV